MNSCPFISVIIPVYNSENYISRCIDSLLSTGMDDMEIIVVDDGSTDKSAKIIEDYCRKNKNIKLIRQSNAGPSAARNKGLYHAQGQYIAFIDSDDYVDSAAFAHQLSFLRNKEVELVVSDFVRVADNGCVLDEVYQIKETDVPIYDMSYLQEFLEAKDCIWNAVRYIFSKDFLKRNRLAFPEGYNIAEDLEFVVRCISLRPRMAFFHEPYYFYRVDFGSSLSWVFSAEKMRQLIEMLMRAMGYLGEQKTDMLIKSKLAREYILNISMLYEVPTEERPVVLKELEKGLVLMEPATGAYNYAAKAIKLLGIPIASWILYMMKRVKRMLRETKIKFFK